MAAGTPWFATLFGRDSIIVALQTLPFQPELARECLRLLADLQGRREYPFTCEEPGKILHEMRQDELSAVGELPYRLYYGSVDSTPLFLILASEYFRWTGDRALIAELQPALDAALRWLEEYGDIDGDGLLEYRTDCVDSLRNQGWKDSTEAIMHADGSLCEGPIALAEVQGYLYAALHGMARVFAATGASKRAAELEVRAAQLKKRFEVSFQVPGGDYIAMALDGAKRQARVMSSNAGQALWGGILDPAPAEALQARLMAPDMFSGWGIRTLSKDAIAYNPLGYHIGTVWPHDNAIIAAGLKRYGADEAVLAIFDGLFGAVTCWPDLRLPELFGGHERGTYSRPVPYPVACRPQAWAAGAWFHLLQATLGLTADATNRRLYLVRPRLPSWLTELRIADLSLGDASVNLTVINDQGQTRVTCEGRDVELCVVANINDARE